MNIKIKNMIIEIPDEKYAREQLYNYGNLECGHRIDYDKLPIPDLITEVLQVGFGIYLGFNKYEVDNR